MRILLVICVGLRPVCGS